MRDDQVERAAAPTPGARTRPARRCRARAPARRGRAPGRWWRARGRRTRTSALRPARQVVGVLVLDGAEGEVRQPAALVVQQLRDRGRHRAALADARAQRRARRPGGWPVGYAARAGRCRGRSPPTGWSTGRGRRPPRPREPRGGRRGGTSARSRASRPAPRVGGPGSGRPSSSTSCTTRSGRQSAASSVRSASRPAAGVPNSARTPSSIWSPGWSGSAQMRLCSAHESAQAGPTAATSSPRSRSGPTRSGPVATRTSAPALAAARARAASAARVRTPGTR